MIASAGILTRFAEIPDSNAGVAAPFLFAGGSDVELIYAAAVDAGTDMDPRVELLDPDGELIAAIGFKACLMHKLGDTTQEILNAHPLYARGLEAGRCFLVAGSTWVDHAERQNAAHRHHQSGMYSALQHVIFPFREALFECLVRQFEVRLYKASRADVVAERVKSAAHG